MGVIDDGIGLLKLVDKAVNADLYKQLGEWIVKVATLQKEVEQLKAENLQLQEGLRFKGKVQRIAGHTYVDGDDEEICPRCAAVDLRAVPLVDMNIDGRGMRATCPQCKTAMGNLAPPLSKKKAKESERSKNH